MTTAATRRGLTAALVLVLLPLTARAWQPNAGDLDTAIKTGHFAPYKVNLTAWLNQKTPARAVAISRDAMRKRLADPAIAAALAQRQLIAKCEVETIDAFAKAHEDNRAFLRWALNNTEAMVLFLEAATPTGLAHRAEDQWTIQAQSLDVWKRIYHADLESRSGMYLKLALGMAVNPPPPEAGHSKIPIDAVARYKHFKEADGNQELVPSFRTLSAWEYSKLAHNDGTTASDEEFAWGREMLRTFRPDLAEDMKVVQIGSMVWRRRSPHPFTNGMPDILAGGGSCGPRSFFTVFINQAFGIPALGVGQPRHACVAYRASDPAAEPQPGSPWKVAYGAGWHVSWVRDAGRRLDGPDFIIGVEARSRKEQFSKVERLRWLASALEPAERADAVIKLAARIAEETPELNVDMTATYKAEEAEADPGMVTESRFGRDAPRAQAGPQEPVERVRPTAPVKAVDAVWHFEAAEFAETGGKISWGGQEPHVLVHDSYTGGQQIYFQQQMQQQWADYVVDIPATGTYVITMKAACINEDQFLEIYAGTEKVAQVDIPRNDGLWAVTEPVAMTLRAGGQTLRVQTPTNEHKRGIALKSFEIKAKK